MILYVNGDSHSAGMEAVVSYGIADEDPKYRSLGKVPHPENAKASYGTKLAEMLSAQEPVQELVIQALPGCSNNTILKKTRGYIKRNSLKELFVVIGWTDWQREDIEHNSRYYTFNASGFDTFPEDLQTRYKQWVIEQDGNKLFEKECFWHQQIFEFHQELVEQKIKHLFFNCWQSFQDINNKLDWQNCYVEPYSIDNKDCYVQWCQAKGFIPTTPKYQHYGADAHLAWAEHLMNYIKEL